MQEKIELTEGNRELDADGKARAQSKTAAGKDGGSNPIARTIQASKTLINMVPPMLPGIIALALARVAVLAVNPSDYLQSDFDMLTDWTGIVKCAGFALVLALLIFDRRRGGDRLWGTSVRAGYILIAATLAFVLGERIVAVMGVDEGTGLAIFKSCASVVATFSQLYWIAQACGAGPAQVIVYIALSRALSEPFAAGMALSPETDWILGLVALAGETACLLWLHKRCAAKSIESSADGDARKASCAPNGDAAPEAETRTARASYLIPGAILFKQSEQIETSGAVYFSGMEAQFKDRRFLTACVVGCIMLSAAAGLLRGYPDGSTIVFTIPTLLIATGLFVLIYLYGAMEAALSKPLLVAAGAISVIEILGVLGVAFYGILPNNLEVGAMFAKDFNDILHAFRQYIAIALMSLGWRNPYYYISLTFLVFLLPRALSRTALIAASSTGAITPEAVSALIILLLMGACLVVFMRIMRLLARPALMPAVNQGEPGDATISAAAPATADRMIDKVLGIEQGATFADIHKAAVARNAETMGSRFGLSKREVEVLTLFSMGHTQKQVAEELFISPSTAHAHIRHIYTKTGMHSRQDILNYFKQMDHR